MTYNYKHVHLHWKQFRRYVKNIRNRKRFIKKYDEYYQVVNEIDHMSDLHADSSFHKQSMKFDNYFKIKEWINSSIGQSTVLQELDKRDLHYLSKSNTKQEKVC